MQDIRAIQLDILRYADSVCRQHCIRYSLSGGTLLGAVRHKGYIPWDDDIDIMLARPEYERLIAILQKSEGQGNGRYKVLNCFLQDECYYTYSKLMDTSTQLVYEVYKYDRAIDYLGVNIDIFPIDGLPNGKSARQFYWNKMRFLKRISTMVYTKVLQEHKESVPKRIFRRCVFFVLGFFPANAVAKCVNRMAMKNDYTASEYAAVSVFGYGNKEQLPRECFDTFIEVQFEGRMYSAIAGYDKYLSNLYGDYMTLPPPEIQYGHHCKTFCYADTAVRHDADGHPLAVQQTTGCPSVAEEKQ